MNGLIDTLLQGGLGNIIDRGRDELLLADAVYNEQIGERELLEKCYNSLHLSEYDKTVINDYITCMDVVNSRISDISYLAGVMDTVRFLNGLGLLK